MSAKDSINRGFFHLKLSQSNSTSLSIGTSEATQTIGIFPHEDDDRMKWKMTRKGVVRSMKCPSLCLGMLHQNISDATQIGLINSQCRTTSWLPIKEGYLRYGASNYFYFL